MMAWFSAFLVHSTLWCGVAWLCLRLFPRTHAGLRETIWYTALAASFITPTAHSLMSPDTAVWQLPMPSWIASAEHHAERERGHEDAAGPVFSLSGEEPRGEEAAVPPGWLASAGTLWVGLAGGLLALYFLRLRILRRRLYDREPVTDQRALQALAALSGMATLDPSPRLTESHHLSSPIALGVGARREICVPARVGSELDRGELRALLGHEVAHHMRRDTIRLAALNILQAIFFFQPLFRLATREVRLAAEELCDDWAAARFDDRFAMASCLTKVAGWVVRRDRHTPVPCIGRRRSQLELRVRRLVSEHRSRRAPARRWRRMGAVGLLLAVAPLVAPAVAPEAEESSEDRHTVEGGSSREHESVREHELH